MMDLIMEIDVLYYKIVTTSLNLIYFNFLILSAFSSYPEFLTLPVISEP